MRPMKKAGLATSGLQKAFPPDLPRRTGKQIGNAEGIIVGVHDQYLLFAEARLIEVIFWHPNGFRPMSAFGTKRTLFRLLTLFGSRGGVSVSVAGTVHRALFRCGVLHVGSSR
jgi:hypothetical protein